MPTNLKFLILIVLSIVAGIHSSGYLTIPFSIIELLLIFSFTNILCKKYKKTAYMLNFAFCLFFLIQIGVLYFSGEYLSLVMLGNLNMINNLGDMLIIYVISSIIIFFICLLPIKRFNFSSQKYILVTSLFVFLAITVFSLNFRNVYLSPISALICTAKSKIEMKVNEYRYRISDEDKGVYLSEFKKDSLIINQSISRAGLTSKPNVILFFVEGFSSKVLDVSNKENLALTPNLDSLYYKSIVFENYYNHTAATFRGIRGQLYSCYQYLDGYDGHGGGFLELQESEVNDRTNISLISLTDILKDEGYSTTFVNVEPQEKGSVYFFNSFNFDKVESYGQTKRIHDKELFEFLPKSIQSLQKPYFLGVYNIETHHGFDSKDIKYGDGTNPVLNKFHNFDYHLGKFLKLLQQSGDLDNTIIVLTADHAAFSSPEFKSTFANTSGAFIDKIPLMIYWNGVKPQIFDADGQNTLDLAPTILDILRISHNNYFLGESLFSSKKNSYNTISTIGDAFFYTGNKNVELIDNGFDNEIYQIRKNYALSLNLQK